MQGGLHRRDNGVAGMILVVKFIHKFKQKTPPKRAPCLSEMGLLPHSHLVIEKRGFQ